MTGEKNGVLGLLRQENTQFWYGAHKLELAVVKCLEKISDFAKVRDALRSLYQEYHYSAKALRELRELAEALDDHISRPANFFGARWLPHLQTALQVLFRGYRTLMMHCQNTKEMHVGSAGRQGRATFAVKYLTSFRGLLFTNFAITREDSDVRQFEKTRMSVLDEIGHNMDERFHYLFNDPDVKSSSVLDPDTWPGDPEELASYGDLTSLHIINFPETFPATHIHRRCRDSETHSRTEVCFHRT